MADENRIAIADLGSNTFRMVVFESRNDSFGVPGGSWREVAEIYQPTRVGADAARDGSLHASAIQRALNAIDLFDQYCVAHGLEEDQIKAVATSAIRDAPNRDIVLEYASKHTRLRPRVITGSEEAGYGHLAAVNSTTLSDGAVLEIGGGSLQLIKTVNRQAQDVDSWALGAVRMTEAFMRETGQHAPTNKRQIHELRQFVKEQLSSAAWLSGCGGRLVGVGGAVRNLASITQNWTGPTDLGVQGVTISSKRMSQLVNDIAAIPVAQRHKIKGLKPARADVILAAAVVIETVMKIGKFELIEATDFGLRQGVFLEHHLREQNEPLFADVRGASVTNLAARFDPDRKHSKHVQKLALGLADALGALSIHQFDEQERQLVAASAILHDIGMAVGYDDHHKHGRYLVISNGLPGFDPRETAMIGQAIRYHRKGQPTIKPFSSVLERQDQEKLLRISAVLRVAEGLERGHDQGVRKLRADYDPATNTLTINFKSKTESSAMACWSALNHAGLFREAFGVQLMVEERE